MPFGLSWDRIILVLIVLVFVVGPERIPTAVNWVMSSLRKLRTMASGAQAELRNQIGPELDELRRQVAELQSLKEIQELRTLRELNPKTIIGKNILGDEFSGGITGFLGLNPPANGGAGNGAAGDGGTNGSAGPAVADGASSVVGGEGSTNGTAVTGSDGAGSNGAVGSGAVSNGSANGHAAGSPPRPARALAVGEAPPIDPDAT